jgi:CHRD domain/PEP-CTERM motif
MSLKPVFALVATAVLALANGTAQAHETVYQASLLGASETPAAITPGSGLATVTIDFDLLTMRVEANFAGLLGNVTAAHIHCCTALPLTGNVGVASMTPSFPGFPTGVKAGSYDQTFDMSLASSYSSAFITAKGGTVGGAFNALVAGLDSGKAYFNVHTTVFPGGEVRALLSPVPEPTTALLALCGMGLVAAVRRRQAA